MGATEDSFMGATEDLPLQQKTYRCNRSLLPLQQKNITAAEAVISKPSDASGSHKKVPNVYALLILAGVQ